MCELRRAASAARREKEARTRSGRAQVHRVQARDRAHSWCAMRELRRAMKAFCQFRVAIEAGDQKLALRVYE